jgi:hypothetical protein
MVLLLAIVLFLFKKLPIGTPRLNAFTTASIAILIIHFINDLSARIGINTLKKLLPSILYLGVIGNIFTSYLNYFASQQYKKQMAIYKATKKNIQEAQVKKVPLSYYIWCGLSLRAGYNRCRLARPQVWVLKTFPAYDMKLSLPVYAITDIPQAGKVVNQLPPGMNAIIAGDGINYQQVEKTERK